jgi:hypothetical protein
MPEQKGKRKIKKNLKIKLNIACPQHSRRTHTLLLQINVIRNHVYYTHVLCSCQPT